MVIQSLKWDRGDGDGVKLLLLLVVVVLSEKCWLVQFTARHLFKKVWNMLLITGDKAIS